MTLRRRSMLASLPALLGGAGPARTAPSPGPATAAAPAATGTGAAPAAPGTGAPPAGVTRRPLHFPADHAAHADTAIEWWYLTGWLAASAQGDAARRPDFGFQVTFFRSRTGLAAASASRFAARQIVFAHIALTDLATAIGPPAAAPRLQHDQRAAREGFSLARTPQPGEALQSVQLRDWVLARPGADGRGPLLTVAVRCAAFSLRLQIEGTQPLLLQGDDGYSRKGPRESQASLYYSEPQLAARGELVQAGRAAALAVSGRAWLDHEWSNELLPPEAVGWDWLGINLFDGSALTAFQLRRADGSALWAGGSHRAGTPGAPARAFAPVEVSLQPGRRWRSAATGADYPVEWTVATPAGRWSLRALLDAQELDSRVSTGAVYWEGLAELRDERGTRVGLGYLEMTGRAGRLRL